MDLEVVYTRRSWSPPLHANTRIVHDRGCNVVRNITPYHPALHKLPGVLARYSIGEQRFCRLNGSVPQVQLAWTSGPKPLFLLLRNLGGVKDR